MTKRLITTLLLVTVPLFGAETQNKAILDRREYGRTVYTNYTARITATAPYPSKMRFKESTDNYNKIHDSGAIGAYGFMPGTLADLGINVEYDAFKANPAIFPPDLQDEAMRKLTDKNERVLARYIAKYTGEIVQGVLITREGILAAAHLGGPGAVKRFFNEGYVARDTHGTTVLDYMEEFSTFEN